MAEKLIILNASNVKLIGILHEANSKSDSKLKNNFNSNQLVIVCHGRLTTKDQYFIPELCEKISKNGITAFRFDFAGNGESEGRFEDSTLTKAIEDIKAVVDFFVAKDYEIFCWIGHSLGGVEVLLHQAKYNSAKKVVAIGAVVNQALQTKDKFTAEQKKDMDEHGFFEVIKDGQKFNVSREYFYDRLSYGDIRKKVSVIKTPVLIVHGTEDKDVPYDNAIMLKDTIQSSELSTIKGAGHFFEDKKHKVQMVDSVIKFLKTK